MRRALPLALLAGLLSLGEARPAAAEATDPARSALWRAVEAVPRVSAAGAPSLRLPDVSGRVVDLRQLRGRVVLVYFWASW